MKFIHVIVVLQLSVLLSFCMMAQPTVKLKPTFENTIVNTNISESEKEIIRKQWEIDDAKIQEYVKANNIDIYWLKSGLYYSMVQQGNGEAPNIDSTVKVKYTLTTLDGAPVWSTNKTGGTEIRALKDFVYGVTQVRIGLWCRRLG